MMGGQTNTTLGSFMDAETGTVYTETAGFNNSGLIDLVYYFGTTNGASFAAPNDATAQSVHTQGTPAGPNELPNWSIKNATKFKLTTISHNEFDDSNNDSLIIANVGSDLTASAVTGLTEDKVVGFTTVGGKKGLILIEAITGDTGDNRAVEVTVKIQK
jgi:hypothetical protein